MVLTTDPYVWGTGRRKSAVARVRIKSGGTGQFVVNGKKVDEFFTTDDTRRAAMAPLNATETLSSYDVWVTVGGGGITGQSDAVKLGCRTFFSPPCFRTTGGRPTVMCTSDAPSSTMRSKS